MRLLLRAVTHGFLVLQTAPLQTGNEASQSSCEQTYRPISQGFYCRWGQLGHLTKLHALASDIVTGNNSERRRQIQSS